MTLQVPWALLGLAVLALPVLIHLLSRTQATVQRFPTLRFLDVSRLLPTRSPRITDVLLLVIRIGVLTAAVVALTQPLFSSRQSNTLGSSVARAIVVDTSLSTTGGVAVAADSIVAQAARYAAQSPVSTTLRTANVGEGVEQAVSWLSTQPGRRELVVLSDFQTSNVDSALLASVPKPFGLKLARITPSSLKAVSDPPLDNAMQSQTTRVEITSEPARTVAEWSLPTSTADIAIDSASNVEVMSGGADKSLAAAAKQAALLIGAPPLADTSMAIAIVYQGAPQFAQLAPSATTLNKPWMGEVVRRLQSDETFHSAVDGAVDIRDTIFSKPFFAIGQNANGRAVVLAASTHVDGRDRLLLMARVSPGSVASAQLIGAAQAAVARAWNASEHETRTLSDATLQAFQREASTDTTEHLLNSNDATTGASDARWLWAIALLLLLVEFVVRRGSRAEASGTLTAETPR